MRNGCWTVLKAQYAWLLLVTLEGFWTLLITGTIFWAVHDRGPGLWGSPAAQLNCTESELRLTLGHWEASACPFYELFMGLYTSYTWALCLHGFSWLLSHSTSWTHPHRTHRPTLAAVGGQSPGHSVANTVLFLVLVCRRGPIYLNCINSNTTEQLQIVVGWGILPIDMV